MNDTRIRRQQSQGSSDDTSCSSDQRQRDDLRRRAVPQQQLLQDVGGTSQRRDKYNPTSSVSDTLQSSSATTSPSAGSSSLHAPLQPQAQDGRGNNNDKSNYADAVMNGSLHDSMTHLDMNNNSQPMRGEDIPTGGDSSSNNIGGNRSFNSQQFNNAQQQLHNNELLPHPDPNHARFASESGGQTTSQHSAINYTDYRRKASDAMSIDQSVSSATPPILPQSVGGDDNHCNTGATILPQQQHSQQEPQVHSPLHIRREGHVSDGGVATYSSIIGDSTTVTHPQSHHLGQSHAMDGNQQQQHQYHHYQQQHHDSGESQQPQHLSSTTSGTNNDTTSCTTYVGEATMAVHNHDYTIQNSSASSSTSQMEISVPTSRQLFASTSNRGNDDGVRVEGRLMERLSDILRRGTLVMINFSQRNLGSNDAHLIRSAILSNPQLAVLKLGYNNLGNVGAKLIAEAIQIGGGSVTRRNSCGDGESPGRQIQSEQLQSNQQQQQQYRHHPSLSVLDLGFNNVSDEGCTALANLAVARNPSLATLYLSGNAVGEAGALALADVIAAGCGLTSLHLTANRICAKGVKGLMRSIAEFDVTMQMALQDRENRIALEEEKKKRVLKSNSRGGGAEGGDEGRKDAILDSLDLGDGDDGPDDFTRLSGYKCIKELHLGGTNMESTGCLSVSNMLLTNLSLRVLCLSDNGLNDQDLSLFSQSISRNRQLPLEVLRLSFNKLTCVGVETLMNAIWGSKSLREIKLDNNQIRDRGAQLAAVVLTSVELEVLDMGFNRLTIVGIKALMKSLAENCSLLTLTLSGNVLDTNASKAVSYALAYNKTIQKLYVDHCSLSYAAQRHIAAGIVSNSKLALRVMSGFPLGAISVTLGLPGAMENWTNEQVLKFIRVMWDRTRHEKEEGGGGSLTSGAASNKAESGNSAAKDEPKSGPSDPATVVAAAKGAFEALGDAGGALLLTEEPQRAISDTSPMVSSDAVMLEKTPSGTVRVPLLNDHPQKHHRTRSHESNLLDTSVSHASVDSLCTANGKSCPETPVDPEAKKRNMEWLRSHYRSLNEIIQLPYVYADLLQLYRYFYSSGEVDDEDSMHDGMPPPGFNLGAAPSPSPQKMSGLQRKISYRGLDIMAGAGGKSTVSIPSSNFSLTSESSSKRRPMSEDESMQPPANKRARSGKPRIDYFPRLKAQVENCLSSSKQTKALILLRQLKFVETTMFQGSNPYCDQSVQAEPNEPTALDAEIILIDMI